MLAPVHSSFVLLGEAQLPHWHWRSVLQVSLSGVLAQKLRKNHTAIVLKNIPVYCSISLLRVLQNNVFTGEEGLTQLECVLLGQKQAT